ncbi:hypothetical protein AB1Y20_017944 [Prymnesium parvum]|uniref:Peptidase S54 rhomboid domain-containing protein n=1 Tax=Prymnesium parvum TaxID=97485 RepID=A0AB34JM23_PRYPA
MKLYVLLLIAAEASCGGVVPLIISHSQARVRDNAITPAPQSLVSTHRSMEPLVDCVLDAFVGSSTCQLMSSPAEVAIGQEGDLYQPALFSSYYRAALVLFLRAVGTPSVSQGLIITTLAGYVAQLKLGEPLMNAGVRDATKVLNGEWHRLVSSCFLHVDAVHVARTCIFGIARLMPTASAIYGNAQSLFIFLLAGVCGNLASLYLGGRSAPPAMGASGALFGIEGALLAYALRNNPYNILGILATLKRSMVTLVACALPRVLGRYGNIDHAAHLGGYVSGILCGMALAPCVQPALENFRRHVFDAMSDHVCELCAPSSFEAERAILQYLRQLPSSERRRTLKEWKLDLRRSKLRERTPPDTEVWPKVWEGVKELVLPQLAGLTEDEDHGTRSLDRENGIEHVFAQEHRENAEAAVIKHFNDRATQALPYLRVLRQPVSLQQIRNMRIGVGALVPWAVAEALAGAVIFWSVLSCSDTVRLALHSR